MSSTKSSAQLGREVAEFLAESPLAGTSDVTQSLLRDSSYGPGEFTRLVATAKPAKTLTPTLSATLAELRARHDRSMGFVSKPLAYSRTLRSGGKREHANLIRLIKGGYVHVCEVRGSPPSGSLAYRDAPFGDRYYVLHVGSCAS